MSFVSNRLAFETIMLPIHFRLKLKELMLLLNEPHREKTGFLPMRKQRRRSASQYM